MAKADIGSKHTISMYNRAWAKWILQEQQIEIEAELSGEFQFVGRATDSLLQVQGQNGRFLVLTEIQFIYDAKMPQRLAAYAALARHKYDLDVFVSVVYLLPPSGKTTLEDAFHRDFMGQLGHQDFQAIGLWNLNAEEVLLSDNPVLLPFIPLMQGGDSEQALRQCATRIRQEPRAEELESFLAFLASYVMDTNLINRILRWEMGIIRESPLAAEIYEQGIRAGRQEGKYETILEWLSTVLIERFQVNNAYLEEMGLQRYDLETLEQAAQFAITVPTLAEFEAHFESLES